MAHTPPSRGRLAGPLCQGGARELTPGGLMAELLRNGDEVHGVLIMLFAMRCAFSCVVLHAESLQASTVESAEPSRHLRICACSNSCKLRVSCLHAADTKFLCVFVQGHAAVRPARLACRTRPSTAPPVYRGLRARSHRPCLPWTRESATHTSRTFSRRHMPHTLDPDVPARPFHRCAAVAAWTTCPHQDSHQRARWHPLRTQRRGAHTASRATPFKGVCPLFSICRTSTTSEPSLCTLHAPFKCGHNTLLHLSVALCRGNCWVLRKGLHELTRATGRQFQRGLLHPTADLVA